MSNVQRGRLPYPSLLCVVGGWRQDIGTAWRKTKCHALSRTHTPTRATLAAPLVLCGGHDGACRQLGYLSPFGAHGLQVHIHAAASLATRFVRVYGRGPAVEKSLFVPCYSFLGDAYALGDRARMPVLCSWMCKVQIRGLGLVATRLCMRATVAPCPRESGVRPRVPSTYVVRPDRQLCNLDPTERVSSASLNPRAASTGRGT